jgi:hypothetical protein
MLPVVFLGEITLAATCVAEALLDWRSRQRRNRRITLAALFMIAAVAHAEIGVDGLFSSPQLADVRAQLGIERNNVSNLCERLAEKDAVILELKKELDRQWSEAHQPQVGPRRRTLRNISPDRAMNSSGVIVFSTPRVC